MVLWEEVMVWQRVQEKVRQNVGVECRTELVRSIREDRGEWLKIRLHWGLMGLVLGM